MKTIETTDGRCIALETIERQLEVRKSQGIQTRFVIDNPANGDVAGKDGGYVEAFSIDEAWAKRAALSIGGGITADALKADGYRIRIYLPGL